VHAKPGERQNNGDETLNVVSDGLSRDAPTSRQSVSSSYEPTTELGSGR
jgi:hypothetical protein